MSDLLNSVQKGTNDYLSSISSNGGVITITKGDGSTTEVQGGHTIKSPEFDTYQSFDDLDRENTELRSVNRTFKGIYDFLIIGAGGGIGEATREESGDGGAIGAYTGVVLNEDVRLEVGTGNR